MRALKGSAESTFADESAKTQARSGKSGEAFIRRSLFPLQSNATRQNPSAVPLSELLRWRPYGAPSGERHAQQGGYRQ